MATRLATAVLVTMLAACSGEVIQTTSGGSSSSSGSSSSGGAIGSGGAPSTTCVPQPEGSGGAPLQPTCADLAVMTVSSPVFVDEGGDGELGPGEKAVLTVKLDEVAGKGFNWYPGVLFSSDTISVEATGEAQFYAILPCQSLDASAQVSLLTKVDPGTVVHMKAQVTMLGMDCPDAPSIQIPIAIQ
jgi:hypothetical protein